MNFKLAASMLGRLLMLSAAMLILPMLVSLGYRESIAHIYALPALCAMGAGLLGVRFGRGARKGLYTREGFLITGAAWLLLGLVGAFPYWIEGTIPRFTDCLFESISGFTTTSATVLTRVESLPDSLLFWRSFTNWVGGMGVLLLFLALLPAMGERSMQLMRAEAPGPNPTKLSPKIGGTARFLYLSYLILTAVTAIALRLAGMPLFDSINHALTTAGTGGFSVRTMSIAYYANPAVNLVLSVGMLLFGLNFVVFFLLITKRFRELRAFSEVRLYAGVIAGAFVLLTLFIQENYETLGEAAGHAFFQTASMLTTTGFVVEDYALWPAAAQATLLILMFVGACSSSTAGGLKLSRLMILLKNTARECRRILRPRQVSILRIDGTSVHEDVVTLVLVYFFCYVALIAAGTLVVAADKTDLNTAFTAVLASASNTGVGLGNVGPGGSFAHFGLLSKAVLSLSMLMGRLEMFPVMVMLMPGTWKK